MSAHSFDVLLHPLCAGFFHTFGNMAVHIQREGCRCVTQIFLYRLHIVTILEGQHGVGMPLWHNKDKPENPFVARS